MRRLVTLLIPTLLLGLVLAGPEASGARQVSAQATPTAPPLVGDVLLRTTLADGLPAAPSLVRLLRITLAPGAAVPMHSHPGPEMNVVESGTLTIEVDGEAILTRAGAAAGPEATPPAAGQAFEMGAGDQITFLEGTPFSLRNEGDEPVVLLSTVVLAAGDPRPTGLIWRDGTPTPDALEGVAFHVLGDGAAPTMPGGPATVTLERVDLDAGEPIPAASGPVLLSVVNGGVEFVVRGGSVQVSRTAAPGPQMDAALGVEYRLQPGDALYAPAGLSETPRPQAAGPLTLLRLSLLGTDVPGATPAAGVEPGAIEVRAGGAPAAGAVTPTVTAPAEEDTAATPVSEAAFEAGTTVVVNESGVRLRAEPSTDAEIVTDLDEGTVLLITGPAEAAGDFLWYPVQDAEDPDLTGYVVEDFVDLAEE